ncbi:DUF664 domain-containing protein [Streptomyces sp. TR06-5]|uniref:mycothiol transferase n=1 Tax=Streptomyces sp. TR06-5 TaxID=3385976 RepID=UPI0039A02EEF
MPLRAAAAPGVPHLTETAPGRGGAPDFSAAKAEWESGFVPREDETVSGLLSLYEEVARETEAAVRSLDSLDETFEAPRVPWDEGGPRTWRWALLHLIEEAAGTPATRT